MTAGCREESGVSGRGFGWLFGVGRQSRMALRLSDLQGILGPRSGAMPKRIAPYKAVGRRGRWVTGEVRKKRGSFASLRMTAGGVLYS